MKIYAYPFENRELTPARDRSPAALKNTYRAILRIRRIEEAIESRYHEDQMKTPIHLSIGQEATAVGVCEALRRTDEIFTSHRSHAPYLAKGGSLKSLMAELHCRKTGCAGGRGGSMHLLDKTAGIAGGSAICGASVPLAAGTALSYQLRGEDHVSSVFFGDGAAEEGVVWETFNFAALKKLPVLFICENNFYSVCTPLDRRQPEGTELFRKAEAFGIFSERIDGSDVNLVYESAARAAARARRGEGPSFLEVLAYRFRAHGGAGNDPQLGYRAAAELDLWQAHCPVEKMRRFLSDYLGLTRDEEFIWEQTIAREIAEAFQFAEQSPLPDDQSLLDYVYQSEGQ